MSSDFKSVLLSRSKREKHKISHTSVFAQLQGACGSEPAQIHARLQEEMLEWSGFTLPIT